MDKAVSLHHHGVRFAMYLLVGTQDGGMDITNIIATRLFVNDIIDIILWRWLEVA